jgi:uncharacterized protein with von Willebrand factor type A (vWA) domain
MKNFSMLEEEKRSVHPTDKGLIDNLIKFSHLLRERAVPVSFASVLDVLRGLRLMDISNLNVFRSLLRMNLVFRKEDLVLFDALFEEFWLARNEASPLEYPVDEAASDSSEGDSEVRECGMSDFRDRQDNLTERLQEWIAGYSPDAINKEGESCDYAECDAFYQQIKKWLKPFSNHPSRRTRYAIRGKQIDLRRILRKNMQFGGELILLDFKKKKLKNRNILFFCDVSGSMDVFMLMLLNFIHALKRIDPRTEIFFFTTDLSRWTGNFKAGQPMEAISRLPDLVSDWGGGTRIGHSLRQFNQSYSQWMLSNKTIAIVFSDGWDLGEAEILESQMAYLHRKAHRVIWLNPLIGDQCYQPICQGMRSALPYIDHLLPMGNLKDLQYLAKTLSKMVT